MSNLRLFDMYSNFPPRKRVERRGNRRSSTSSEDEDPHPRPTSHILRPGGGALSTARVKRSLFGPTDPEENLRFVRQEMKRHRDEANSRWNFDFEIGQPLKGPYEWEATGAAPEAGSTALRTAANSSSITTSTPLSVGGCGTMLTASDCTVTPPPSTSNAIIGHVTSAGESVCTASIANRSMPTEAAGITTASCASTTNLSAPSSSTQFITTASSSRPPPTPYVARPSAGTVRQSSTMTPMGALSKMGGSLISSTSRLLANMARGARRDESPKTHVAPTTTVVSSRSSMIEPSAVSQRGDARRLPSSSLDRSSPSFYMPSPSAASQDAVDSRGRSRHRLHHQSSHASEPAGSDHHHASRSAVDSRHLSASKSMVTVGSRIPPDGRSTGDDRSMPAPVNKTKEQKITEVFRQSRKASRSKSASKLRLKRLESGNLSRSPSVSGSKPRASRATSLSRDRQGRIETAPDPGDESVGALGHLPR